MASHKSAIKRIRQNETRRVRNVHYKSVVRGRIRRVREAIAAAQPDVAREALVNAMSAIDRIASKGVIHRNTAARRIARLSRAVHRFVSGVTAPR